jgi:O-antigen ligase
MTPSVTQKESPPFGIAGLLIVAFCGLLIYLFKGGAPLILIGLPVAVIGLTMLAFRPDYVVLLAVLSSIFAIYNPPGLHPTELIYYGLSALALSMFVVLALNGNFRIEGPIDRAWVFLMTMIGIGLIIGLLVTRSVRPFEEFGYIYTSVLFYPGLRYFLRREDFKKKFMIGLGLIFSYVVVRSIVDYRQSLLNVVEEWQLNFIRSAGTENTLLLFCAFLLIVLVNSTSLKRALLPAGAFVLSFIALILTFTRSLWGAFFIAAVMIFLLSPTRLKTRILGYSIGGTVLVGLVMMLFIPDLVAFITGVIAFRFETLGGVDLSLEERIIETRTVWQSIMANPILGHGLSTEYFRYVILNKFVTVPSNYVHNGYLAVWYKFGIFGLLSFLTFYAVVFRESLRLYRLGETEFARLVGLSIVAYISGMLIMNIVSPTFISFEGMFISMCVALIAATYTRSVPA